MDGHQNMIATFIKLLEYVHLTLTITYSVGIIVKHNAMMRKLRHREF